MCIANLDLEGEADDLSDSPTETQSMQGSRRDVGKTLQLLGGGSKQINVWQRQLDQLETWVRDAQCLPKRSATDSVERSLYRWVSRQHAASNLTIAQQVAFADVLQLAKRSSEGVTQLQAESSKQKAAASSQCLRWRENMDKVQIWVQSNDRLPSRYAEKGTDERQLGRWFRRQGIDSSILSASQRKEVDELRGKVRLFQFDAAVQEIVSWSAEHGGMPRRVHVVSGVDSQLQDNLAQRLRGWKSALLNDSMLPAEQDVLKTQLSSWFADAMWERDVTKHQETRELRTLEVEARANSLSILHDLADSDMSDDGVDCDSEAPGDAAVKSHDAIDIVSVDGQVQASFSAKRSRNERAYQTWLKSIDNDSRTRRFGLAEYVQHALVEAADMYVLCVSHGHDSSEDSLIVGAEIFAYVEACAGVQAALSKAKSIFGTHHRDFIRDYVSDFSDVTCRPSVYKDKGLAVCNIPQLLEEAADCTNPRNAVQAYLCLRRNFPEELRADQRYLHLGLAYADSWSFYENLYLRNSQLGIEKVVRVCCADAMGTVALRLRDGECEPWRFPFLPVEPGSTCIFSMPEVTRQARYTDPGGANHGSTVICSVVWKIGLLIATVFGRVMPFGRDASGRTRHFNKDAVKRISFLVAPLDGLNCDILGRLGYVVVVILGKWLFWANWDF